MVNDDSFFIVFYRSCVTNQPPFIIFFDLVERVLEKNNEGVVALQLFPSKIAAKTNAKKHVFLSSTKARKTQFFPLAFRGNPLFFW